MKLQPMQWLIGKLLDRLVPLVGTAIASRFQTFFVLDHAEQQDQLEQRAREFEADGKPHLAEALRREASAIVANNPAGTALPMIQNLESDEHGLLPQPSDNSDAQLSLLDGDRGDVAPRKPRKRSGRRS